MTESPDEYSPDSIHVLKGLEAISKRPGLYIGDTGDGTGLHNMVYGVVDYAVDNPWAREVIVRLNADRSCTVRDDGPGMPTDEPKAGLSAAEVIMTDLHDRPRPTHDIYGPYMGWHAASVSVVNVLSSSLKLTVWRDGKEHFMEFRDGEALAPLAVVGAARDSHGTEVTFLPNPKIFSMTEFDFATLEHRLREHASRLPGITIILSDMRQLVERREVMSD